MYYQPSVEVLESEIEVDPLRGDLKVELLMHIETHMKTQNHTMMLIQTLTSSLSRMGWVLRLCKGCHCQEFHCLSRFKY